MIKLLVNDRKCNGGKKGNNQPLLVLYLKCLGLHVNMNLCTIDMAIKKINEITITAIMKYSIKFLIKEIAFLIFLTPLSLIKFQQKNRTLPFSFVIKS
jgi:hypothetical protein